MSDIRPDRARAIQRDSAVARGLLRAWRPGMPSGLHQGTKRTTKRPATRGARNVLPVVRRMAGAQTASAARRRLSGLATEEARFAEVVALIEAARNRAYQAVN